MKPTYLYIKTHKTGLKYFGKTVENPFVYKGSGVVWLRHIHKYGNDVTTEVLNNGLPFTTPETLSETALNFSRNNNIVDSTEWANLMDEDGFSGGDFTRGYSESEYQKLCERNKQTANRPDVIAKKRASSIVSQNRPDVKMKKSVNGKIAQNDPVHKEKHKQIMKEVMKEPNLIKLECPHCGKLVVRHMFGRWHGDKCKQKV